MQRLLPITPGTLGAEELVELAEGFSAMGLRGLLLRQKERGQDELLALEARLRPLLPELIVHAGNRACTGPHLHLAAEMPVGPWRARCSGRLGVSTHSHTQALAAQAAGADYVLLSPAFPPCSKADTRAPLGLKAVAATQRALSIPVFALGGMDPDRARQARGLGIHGAACIGAIFDAADPLGAARQMAAALAAQDDLE